MPSIYDALATTFWYQILREISYFNEYLTLEKTFFNVFKVTLVAGIQEVWPGLGGDNEIIVAVANISSHAECSIGKTVDKGG